jgi:WD40 repeat protein
MSLVKTPVMAPKSTRPTQKVDKFPAVMTLGGHGEGIGSISYFPDGKQMISGSGDGTSRRWNLETGKEIEEARDVGEHNIRAVKVSRDGRWVVTSTAVPPVLHRGEIKAWDLETETVKTFGGYPWDILCIDISVDSKLLAGGGEDGFRIWRLDAGNLLGGPSEFKTPSYRSVSAIRFSQDSTKLAVYTHRSGIEVWDIQARKLVVCTNVRKGTMLISPSVPLFWTTKDRTIVAAITYPKSQDDDDIDEDLAMRRYDRLNMINELDPSTLESVSAPFEGHTDNISSLALSYDCALLASASQFDRIKVWAFESRQLLASFGGHHRVTRVYDLTFSPNSRQLAYSGPASGQFGQPTKFSPPKIYIYDIPNILVRIRPEQEAPNVRICSHLPLPWLTTFYGLLNLNIHSSLINLTYVILFVHLSLLLILHLSV